MVGPAVQREAVAHLRAVTGLSERRACALVGADRKMIRYLLRRPAETELRARLRELATSADGSDTDACSACCGGRASDRARTASTGSAARRA
jgi:hypothetical protein